MPTTIEQDTPHLIWAVEAVLRTEPDNLFGAFYRVIGINTINQETIWALPASTRDAAFALRDYLTAVESAGRPA